MESDIEEEGGREGRSDKSSSDRSGMNKDRDRNM
jgi:hypothetical protein